MRKRRVAREKNYGASHGRPRIGAELEKRILEALNAPGGSVRKTAARFGVNPSTVQRIKSPLGANAARGCWPSNELCGRLGDEVDQAAAALSPPIYGWGARQSR